jgi:uncharacterized phage protein (predicted DNA packaging)
MSIALDEVKEFCRISGNDDDALLGGLTATAEAMVQAYLNRDLDMEFPGNWPAPCSTAALFLVADIYDNRDAAPGEVVLPPRVRMLLAPYRVFA